MGPAGGRSPGLLAACGGRAQAQRQQAQAHDGGGVQRTVPQVARGEEQQEGRVITAGRRGVGGEDGEGQGGESGQWDAAKISAL